MSGRSRRNRGEPIRALMAALALALLARSGAAQSTGTIVGAVTVSDSIAVALARVAVAGTTIATIAETNGRFRLGAVPAGHLSLDVRRIGYLPLSLPVDLRAGETLRVRVDLTALDPVALERVEVTAHAPMLLRGFEARRARGPGVFLSYDDIARMQARQVTDVLRRVPGIQVRPLPGPYGPNLAVVQRGGNCPVMFFLNGSPFPISDVPINNYVSADELLAVEVYSQSEIPAELDPGTQASRCGVVGLWTRHGNLPARR